jgi:putative spermidine/putrescine transport system ATP-binding protein
METARFLGPANTIGPSLARLLGLETCWLRPEALRLEKNPDGPGTVGAVHFAGHYLSYTVRILDQELVIYALEPMAQTGDRVRIHVSNQYPPIMADSFPEDSCA